MNSILISGRSCYIPECAESPDNGIMVSADDIERYSQDKRFMQNERIAYEAMFAVSKAFENAGCDEKTDYENSGIVFCSSCGCIEAISEAESNIAVKAEKGVSPRGAVNSILCGAGSKNAIKFGLKDFNITELSNNGIDAVITAYKLITETNSSFAVACAGDTDSAYSALVLKNSGTEINGTFISGYSKGTVFGDDTDSQFDYLIRKALKSRVSGDGVSHIVVCDDTGKYGGTLSEICKKLCKNAVLNNFRYPDNAGFAKGMIAIMYAEKLLTTGQSALVIQVDNDGRFSCIVVERK